MFWTSVDGERDEIGNESEDGNEWHQDDDHHQVEPRVPATDFTLPHTDTELHSNCSMCTAPRNYLELGIWTWVRTASWEVGRDRRGVRVAVLRSGHVAALAGDSRTHIRLLSAQHFKFPTWKS